MHRRTFLRLGVGAAAGANLLRVPVPDAPPGAWNTPPAWSVIPVVGDGKWIWTKPPEGQTGYLEPRPFSLKVGIELEGLGGATNVMATTPVPIACPEQKIDQERVEVQGCEAKIVELAPTARELLLVAPPMVKGQRVAAYAHLKLTLYKQYHGYSIEQFPAEQKTPADVAKQYLGNSPGIETRNREIRDLQEQIAQEIKHPWDKARAFASWIPRNIRPKMGSYLGPVKALEMKLGDCEDMSALFVALCRAADIPARLVWVPNHNWSEFYLTDQQGQGHWVPAHTACYFWWGWTGVHELVIQKGDRIWVPERRKHYRLQEDWLQWMGRKPRARYVAELTPEAPKPAAPGDAGTAPAAFAPGDPGPGARRKVESGEWQLVGNHALDKVARR